MPYLFEDIVFQNPMSVQVQPSKRGLTTTTHLWPSGQVSVVSGQIFDHHRKTLEKMCGQLVVRQLENASFDKTFNNILTTQQTTAFSRQLFQPDREYILADLIGTINCSPSQCGKYSYFADDNSQPRVKPESLAFSRLVNLARSSYARDKIPEFNSSAKTNFRKSLRGSAADNCRFTSTLNPN